MIKFMVVLYKKPGLDDGAFRRYFREVHGPLAERLPGLVAYRQNHVLPDPRRDAPGWHGIAELVFESREAMEAAWASPEGEAATGDLEAFADLARTR